MTALFCTDPMGFVAEEILSAFSKVAIFNLATVIPLVVPRAKYPDPRLRIVSYEKGILLTNSGFSVV